MTDPGFHPRAGSRLDLGPLLRRDTVQAVRQLVRPEDCHLVGGILRDTVLGTRSSDIDLVVSSSGRRLAERLADTFRTRVIELGGDRFAAYRVPIGHDQIDIWDRGSSGLEADLRRRDLTIHSFAVDVHSGQITDPFGGCRDLRAGTLRMTTRFAFDDDPLRVMRLCRFAAQLSGFRVDPDTLQQAAGSSPGLAGVASERIRLEVASSLTQLRAAEAVTLWVEVGVFPDILLGEALKIEARQRLESDLNRASAAADRVARLLRVGVDLTPARLGLLLKAYQKFSGIAPQEAVGTMRAAGFLTRKESDRIQRVLGSPSPPMGEPQRRWYLHSLADLWPAALALASATAEIDMIPEHRLGGTDLRALIDLATDSASEIFDPPPLVTGSDLQRELGLEAGPRLGHILAEIRRLQIEGAVTSRRQALRRASELTTDSRRNLDGPAPSARSSASD